MIRTYEELVRFPTFEERFGYLKLNGVVGEETFGYDRILNQQFYNSYEWRELRDRIILRDNGCDLGIAGREIGGKIYIHHMNPITARDICERSRMLTAPEYLICVSFETHNAIHYGDENLLITECAERTKNDTCPWKK